MPFISVAQTADPLADRRTKNLFNNLQSLAQNKTLFGHQDDLAYGVFWKDEKDRSDVKEVVGAYPAVFGWDIGRIGKWPYNLDTVDFKKMQGWIKQGYAMGSINTISWHMDNLKTGGDSWDNTAAIKEMLPGGPLHNTYKAKLDAFAHFLKALKGGGLFKHQIPIIFRPFHEHNGSWFWWGKGHTTAADFKALWIFTYEYLTQEKNIHHLLYAFSTDVFSSEEDYFNFYPGDEYVDILGYDDYHGIKADGDKEALNWRVHTLCKWAKERGKIPAMTETGYETIPKANWWTEDLLSAIPTPKAHGTLAYVLCWRNGRKDHHYAPYPGHLSAEDFKAFKASERIYFADQLPGLYRKTAKK